MNKDLKNILRDLRRKNTDRSNLGIQLKIDDDGLMKMKGQDGYTPIKGVDYWTPEEVEEMVTAIFNAAKPNKGKDYFTKEEKKELIEEVLKMATPIKGVHYRDGKDGEDGEDGVDGENPDPRQVAVDAITLLESFEGDARLSAKALKDLDEAVTEILKKGADFELSEKQITTIKDLLPKYPPINAGGSGATFLKSLRDVDLSGLTKNAEGKYVLGGSGASTFLALTDTPSSYSGQAGKAVVVNGTADGLEFTPLSGGGDMLASTYDPANKAEQVLTISDATDFAPALGADDNYVTDAEKAALHTHSNKSVLDATTASFTTSDETKLDYITVTQAVDLDAIETRVNQLDAAVVLKGSWNASAGTFPGSGTAQAGDSYIVSVGGTVDSVVFNVGDRIVAILDNASTSTYASNWLKLDYTDQVSSVAGKTGAVTLVTADITDITASAAELNILDGATLSTTELNYVDGVTSAIQTQLDSKLASSAYDDATAAETNTGTSTAKYVSPDGLAGSNFGVTKVNILVSDPGGSAITTGNGKAYHRIPAELNGMNLVGVSASLSTVSSSGAVTVMVRRSRRSSATARTDADMLSTAITIDQSEFDTVDAATAAVINTSNDDVATGDHIYIDIDGAGTGAKGLLVELRYQLP